MLDPDGAFGAAGEDETTASVLDWFRVKAAANAPIELPAYCDLYLDGAGYSDSVRVPVVIGDSMNLPAGPDRYGYRIYDYTDSCYDRMPAYDWVELRGIGTRLIIGSDETQQFALPPSFGTWRYYGVDYDTISVCSNGFIAAGWTDRPDFVNVELPYPNSPSNIVAVQWDDLDPTAFGSIWYYHDSAHHRLIVEYDSVPYFGHLQDWEKVQVQVYDRTVTTPTGDNSIVVQYQTANNFSQATVGLQNRDGSSGLTHEWNNHYPRVSAPIRAGRALRFETVALSGAAEPAPGLTGRGLALSVSPNPFRTRAAARLEGGRIISASVFDPAGRRVRDLVPTAAGFSWDAVDGSGRRAKAGVYFIRVRTDVGELGQRVILVP